METASPAVAVNIPSFRAADPLATRAASLYRWAFHRAIGTVNTAVPLFRLQYLVTAFTLVKPLAGIRWHDFHFLVATDWASDLRVGDYLAHLATSGIGHSLFTGHIKSATDIANINIRAA